MPTVFVPVTDDFIIACSDRLPGWYVNERPSNIRVGDTTAPNGYNVIPNLSEHPTVLTVVYPDSALPMTYRAHYDYRMPDGICWLSFGDFTIPFPPPPPVSGCVQGTEEEILAAGYTILSGPYETEAECDGACL